MRLSLGEPLHLILDGRAVAWSLTGYLTTIDGRKMDRFSDDAVRFGRRPGDTAFNLRDSDPAGHAGKGHWRVVGGLRLKPVPLDCPAVKARRGARFQPSNRQVERPKPGGKHVRRHRQYGQPGDFLAKMDKTAKKGSGGQNDGTGMVADSASSTTPQQTPSLTRRSPTAASMISTPLSAISACTASR